jgi:hypothetical protein
MEMSGQHHGLATQPPKPPGKKTPSTYYIGDWVSQSGCCRENFSCLPPEIKSLSLGRPSVT